MRILLTSHGRTQASLHWPPFTGTRPRHCLAVKAKGPPMRSEGRPSIIGGGDCAADSLRNPVAEAKRHPRPGARMAPHAQVSDAQFASAYEVGACAQRSAARLEPESSGLCCRFEQARRRKSCVSERRECNPRGIAFSRMKL
jgi:hypothetical protein